MDEHPDSQAYDETPAQQTRTRRPTTERRLLEKRLRSV